MSWQRKCECCGSDVFNSSVVQKHSSGNRAWRLCEICRASDIARQVDLDLPNNEIYKSLAVIGNILLKEIAKTK